MKASKHYVPGEIVVHRSSRLGGGTTIDDLTIIIASSSLKESKDVNLSGVCFYTYELDFNRAHQSSLNVDDSFFDSVWRP